jgi:transcriptional regulator with XRE-family HTH domain
MSKKDIQKPLAIDIKFKKDVQKAIALDKKLRKKEVKHLQSELILERIKFKLKLNKKNFDDLAEALEISSSGLYRAFNRGSVTLVMFENIAKFLKVHTFYFFEDDIIERLSEETRKYTDVDKLSVKEFLMSLSLDVKKGMKIEDAAYKNIDSKGYFISLGS